MDAVIAEVLPEIEAACRPGADPRLLRLAMEILPAEAVEARRRLGTALTAVVLQRLQRRPAPPPARGPLRQAAMQAPHPLLDRCYEHLASVPRQGVFEARSGQREMAHAVLEALEKQEVLVVEAGTGSGKSLAYALAAIVHTVRSGRRVVIATHTRTLQEQLVQRELPWLWASLDLDAVPRSDGGQGLRFAKLLGRGNYVCVTALDRWVQAWRERGGNLELLRLLLALLRRDDGSLDEILPGCAPEHLEAVRSRRETCAGRACRGDPPCPVYTARERARAADLVIVNHALLCEDGRLEGTLLGDCGGLVVDEAHALEGVATEALAVRLHAGRGETLVVAARRLEAERRATPGTSAALEELVVRLGERCQAVRRQLLLLLETLDAALPRAARVRPRQRYRDADEVFGRVQTEVTALREALELGLEVAAQAESECLAAAVTAPAAGLAELAGVVLSLLQEASQALECVLRAADDDWVYHLDFSGTDSALTAIVATPLEVGAALQQLLSAPERAVIYTSATLFVEGDAAFVRRRLGLASTVRQLTVESPFEYAAQCTVVHTASLGDYRDPEFVPAMAVLVENLHRETQRRMLVLLTSHSMLRALHAELVQRLGGKAPLLAQGITAERATLADRLTATPAAILLGTASFWEGVDFPGEALEVLVLAKLPFAPPDEPLVEARCERLRARGEDPFADFLLPEAVLRFRQGFGRLIRTRQDRGAVLLLDGRLESRAYGETFVASLPVRTRSFETPETMLAHVRQWFESGPQLGSP